MTTNKDDNRVRTVQPARTDARTERAERPHGREYRTGEQLDPQDTPRHADKRSGAQGRGNDPDRG